MTWPPPPPEPPSISPRPWDPRSRADPDLVGDAARLVYAVVEEAVGEWRGMSVSTWPDADSAGRLRFTSGVGPLELVAATDSLARFLHGDEAQAVDIGAVFAARVKEGTAEDFLRRWEDRAETSIAELSNLDDWLERPVLITEEARGVAKLAYYSALLSTLPEALESAWEITYEEDGP